MNILFLGDIVGRSGRAVAKRWIPKLKASHRADIVIVNGENLAGGSGITPSTAQEMFDAGADVITSGNHIWKQSEVFPLMQKRDSRILRPANYPPGCPGRGDVVVETKSGKNILVINVQGRTFMKDATDCPLRAMDAILKKYSKKHIDAVFVDFHAEATAEKMTLLHYLDGRVSVLVGTHTHVPTQDAHITDQGTAYVTDVGGTYSRDSSIGVEFEGPLYRMMYQMPKSFEVAMKGPFYLCAVVAKVDTEKKLQPRSTYGTGIGRPTVSFKHLVKIVP